jgi:hypothetical protein
MFLSLLTTKEVFEKTQLGFFIVSHMDEDINGSYGYLSTILKYIYICVGRLNEAFRIS